MSEYPRVSYIRVFLLHSKSSVFFLFVQPHSETLCVSVCVLCLWVSVSSAGCISGCEFPFPVSSPGVPSLPDDLCVVFVVELDKGPYGLGMGLIDGLVSRQTHFSQYIEF